MEGNAEKGPAVLYEVKDRIATITFNRPEIRHAWTGEVAAGISAAIRRLASDKEARVAILTGKGTAFCAGANLKDPLVHTSASIADFHECNDDAPQHEIKRCPKPVIAAVNGPAFGIGATMAISCDLRIFSTAGYVCWPEVNLGHVVPDGIMVQLARLAGSGRAMEIMMRMKKVFGEEAFQIGLANHVVPPEQLMTAAWDVAKELTMHAPLSLAFIKEMLYQGLDMGLQNAIHADRYRMFILYNSQDRDEGHQARREKRDPNFTGR